ncbi:paraquat-inducible protein A [Roseibium aestuarii]|uniref:Paraquat-inducible protein A n=1 Tax=Roseibium aestuarii TaxID=2600299 RepID=A0ABW4JV78_9HYPH|nr:paraquat-inducible protein A [Roseibium aestuarii]
MRLLLSLLLPVSTFAFALGITLPLLRFDRLYFFQERPSLIGMLHGLWIDGEMGLALLVGTFSLLLPACKILLLHVVLLAGRQSRSLVLLSGLSKWSMLDVMVVALVVFAAKTSGLAAASVLPGLWFYGIAALGTAVAAQLCKE